MFFFFHFDVVVKIAKILLKVDTDGTLWRSLYGINFLRCTPFSVCKVWHFIARRGAGIHFPKFFLEP